MFGREILKNITYSTGGRDRHGSGDTRLFNCSEKKSDPGTESRMSVTIFACLLSSSCTSHGPSNPVAPVMSTERFFQKLFLLFVVIMFDFG